MLERLAEYQLLAGYGLAAKRIARRAGNRTRENERARERDKEFDREPAYASIMVAHKRLLNSR